MRSKLVMLHFLKIGLAKYLPILHQNLHSLLQQTLKWEAFVDVECTSLKSKPLARTLTLMGPDYQPSKGGPRGLLPVGWRFRWPRHSVCLLCWSNHHMQQHRMCIIHTQGLAPTVTKHINAQ